MNGRMIYQALWATLIGACWLVALAGFLYAPYAIRMLMQKQQSISIFAWSDIIDAQTVKEFEEQTGIRVFLNYHESNDELLTKLRFSHGVGYDLFMPSHYMIKTMVRDGLIKKIDKSKLDFWQDLDPHLLGREDDPANEYTIPYIWDVYGLCVDTRFFADKPFEPSWRMLFEPPFDYRVGMTDEPREITDLASLYLYGDMHDFDNKRRHEIAQLLIKQKRSVEAYTDVMLDFLLTSGSCPIVLATSYTIYRARRQMPWAQFILPREGTVMAVESVVIASKTTKEPLVYKFINFLYKHQAIKRMYENYGYLTSIKPVLSTLDLSYIDFKQLSGPYAQKVSLIRPLIPRHELFEFWLSIKAH
jgi:spermidine/putrescine transport system substrate-binding protein